MGVRGVGVPCGASVLTLLSSQARLAAAEAALQAVNEQRDDLTTERAAWLEQLQQENLQLRHVHEEARRAKERLVEVRYHVAAPLPADDSAHAAVAGFLVSCRAGNE